MAGTGVGKFSSTAGSNTANMTVNFAENMAPSNVNNAARELMGHMRDMYEQLGDGYFEYGDGDGTYTIARVDADSLTVASASDLSAIYFAGRKIRVTDGGANVVEGTIASTSHGSSLQTVNMTGITLASGTPTKVEIGIDTAAFGGKLIFDDDGDTYMEAPTDDTLDIYVAGAKDFVITANTFTAESGSTIAAQALTATTVTASGIIKTDDTTAATSTTDGSLQTDGGLSVVLDAVIGDDLYMKSDAAVIHFGADSEITLTHNADAGLTLGGTTPTLTMGDGGAEDTKIIFDGNAQNFHIGLDDTTDDLVIGLGNTLGTYPAITIDENTNVTIPDSSLTVIGSGNYALLTLKTTDDDTAEGPFLNFVRDPSGVANGDLDGTIKFTADNNAGEAIVYNELQSSLGNVADGSEGGRITLYQMIAGTARNIMDISQGNVIFNQDSIDGDFRVESDGLTHALFVDAGNNRIGIGEDAPDAVRLHVKHDIHNTFATKFEHTGDVSSVAPYGIQVFYSGGAPDSGTANACIEFADTGATRFIVYGDGDCYNHDGAFNAISDERIKQDITDANSQWDDIKALRIRNFRKKDDIRAYGDDAKTQIGVIAQEALLVSPKLVTEVKPTPADVQSSSEFGTLYEDGDTIPDDKEIGDVKEVKDHVKGFKYSILHMKAVKALQEAMTRIETLETKVTALEG